MNRPGTSYRRTVAILLIATGLSCVWVAGGLALFGSDLRRLYDDVVLDNRGHGLACADLPPSADVDALLVRNVATVEAILALDDGRNMINVVTVDECPDGGSSILITYGTHAQRERIEEIIRGTELERAPINWQNV